MVRRDAQVSFQLRRNGHCTRRAARDRARRLAWSRRGVAYARSELPTRRRPPACSRRCTRRRRRCRTCAGACRPARPSEPCRYLRALTGAAAIALADTRAVLAIDGEGREQVRPGDLLSRLLERTPDHRIHVVPKLVSSDPSCPLRSAVLAPLVVQGKRVGTLILFYKSVGPSQSRRAARRPGGRKPGRRPGRAVGRLRAGGAPRAGGAARAPRADLAPLHLQRAGRGRRRHPRAARRGARAADRLRGVHALPVPGRPLVRDAGRGGRPRRALPAPRAGALPRPQRDDRRPRRCARHRGPRDVAAAAGRERRQARRRAARRHAAAWRSRRG